VGELSDISCLVDRKERPFLSFLQLRSVVKPTFQVVLGRRYWVTTEGVQVADGTPADESATAAGGPPDFDGWLARWLERTDAADRLLPGDEARQVLAAVLEVADGAGTDVAERAGRAWGRAHRSVSLLVRRLSTLREALADRGAGDPVRMHRAVDRVTVEATEEVMRRLEHASRTDPLTGVGNRRAFEETLQAALSAATRQGHEITVVEVDLDGLKRLNDEQGHAAGDAALLALVRAFYAALRDEDTVFRVGGDEFMILLPFTSAEDAAVLMERVAAGDAPPFTWGASGFPGDATEAVALVAAADQDLYRRRHVRRAPRRTGRVGAVLGLDAEGRWRRMTWVPAAAVLLLVALAATLLVTSGSTPRSATTASPKGVVTRGHHGGSSPGTGTGPGTGQSGAGQGTGTATTTGGPGGSVLSVAFLGAPVSSGSPAGGSTGGSPSGPGSGSSGGSPPGSNPPPPASPGGVLGLVGNLPSGIPLVGGSNGLLATLTQLLTGSPTVTAATAAAVPVTPGATTTATTAPGGPTAG